MYHKDGAKVEKSLSVAFTQEEQNFQMKKSLFKAPSMMPSRQSEAYGTQKTQNDDQDPYAQQMAQDPYTQQESHDPYSQP